ncbi:MAG: ABC transporter permease [Proteobacteria bacterium]|nr:ABC transporter permease [Pseudomonadota bacterium]
MAITRAVFKHKLSRAGIIIIITFCLMAIFSPFLAPYDPSEQDLYNVLSGPTKAHLLGTDNVGRDLLSRIIYGSRITMGVALFASMGSTVIGVTLGLIAGFKGGWVDTVIMRIVDIVMVLPGLLIVLVLAAALGPGFTNIVIAITLIGWTGFARTIRGQVLQVRELPFVEASRAAGATNTRLMFKHLLPNAMAPIIVMISLSMGFAISIEAGAAFLGLGVQPPTPSWGQALRVGYSYLEMIPLYSIAPGIMITLAILAFNFLGDGLRDALDPRLRGEGKKQ